VGDELALEPLVALRVGLRLARDDALGVAVANRPDPDDIAIGHELRPSNDCTAAPAPRAGGADQRRQLALAERLRRRCISERQPLPAAFLASLFDAERTIRNEAKAARPAATGRQASGTIALTTSRGAPGLSDQVRDDRRLQIVEALPPIAARLGCDQPACLHDFPPICRSRS
jgi:hypothetical protein